MRKIKSIAIALAAATVVATGVAGMATLAQAEPNTGGAAATRSPAKVAQPEPAPGAIVGSAAATASGERTSVQQRVVTSVSNRSGQVMTLLESSTLGHAPFGSEGTHRQPKAGQTVADSSAYSYLNSVKLPNAAMETTTLWKVGSDATLKLYQGSTESRIGCEIQGSKAADYTCKVTVGAGSGGGTDVTDVVISKR
ncbi:hypothetical protein AB0D66_33675 [Streptomyces sp. NPDC048270]|uniref:hypothetical protein n=1 Tax=Streptomyces sp. NPDC048270 TaxID=3154615 RepID=UPI003411F0BC